MWWHKVNRWLFITHPLCLPIKDCLACLVFLCLCPNEYYVCAFLRSFLDYQCHLASIHPVIPVYIKRQHNMDFDNVLCMNLFLHQCRRASGSHSIETDRKTSHFCTKSSWRTMTKWALFSKYINSQFWQKTNDTNEKSNLITLVNNPGDSWGHYGYDFKKLKQNIFEKTNVSLEDPTLSIMFFCFSWLIYINISVCNDILIMLLVVWFCSHDWLPLFCCAVRIMASVTAKLPLLHMLPLCFCS